MTPPPPSRTTDQFTHGQFARKPGDPRGPRTSRNPSINAPCMEVTTAPSMSIISINAGVPVCAPRAASSVCTAHVNLDSDIIGESRHKAGGHTQCNNTRSVTVAGMLHSVVPDESMSLRNRPALSAHLRAMFKLAVALCIVALLSDTIKSLELLCMQICLMSLVIVGRQGKKSGA